MISSALVESRPLVTSSSRITEGSFTSSTARLRRRRWPPDRPLRKMLPTIVFSAVRRPVASMSAWTLSSRSALDASRAMVKMAA